MQPDPVYKEFSDVPAYSKLYYGYNRSVAKRDTKIRDSDFTNRAVCDMKVWDVVSVARPLSECTRWSDQVVAQAHELVVDVVGIVRNEHFRKTFEIIVRQLLVGKDGQNRICNPVCGDEVPSPSNILIDRVKIAAVSIIAIIAQADMETDHRFSCLLEAGEMIDVEFPISVPVSGHDRVMVLREQVIIPETKTADEEYALGTELAYGIRHFSK